jgi:hypothetical protein
VSTTDLTQLMTALTTLVAGLGGVMAFVGARLTRRQREAEKELRDLREYAALVSRWGFRIRVLLAANGLDAPPMPALGGEDEQDTDTERDREANEARAARPVAQLDTRPLGIGNLGEQPVRTIRSAGAGVPNRADPRAAVAPDREDQTPVQRASATAPPARHRLGEPAEKGADWGPTARGPDWSE